MCPNSSEHKASHFPSCKITRHYAIQLDHLFCPFRTISQSLTSEFATHVRSPLLPFYWQCADARVNRICSLDNSERLQCTCHCHYKVIFLLSSVLDQTFAHVLFNFYQKLDTEFDLHLHPSNNPCEESDRILPNVWDILTELGVGNSEGSEPLMVFAHFTSKGSSFSDASKFTD